MLCWLAWKIATASPAPHAQDAGRRTLGFWSGAAFQLVNPKAWLVAVSASATFLDGHAGGALGQAAALGALFLVAALPSCFPWLAFGAVVQRFLRTARARRVFNVGMGAVLAASVLLFVWPRP
jgi:threonine/homoserine/homoserine lactone efflux protein